MFNVSISFKIHIFGKDIKDEITSSIIAEEITVYVCVYACKMFSYVFSIAESLLFMKKNSCAMEKTSLSTFHT